MLKLSGLDTNISEAEEQQWIDALNTQIAFLNHLDDNAATSGPSANGSEVFRLLASDHHPPEPLTLEMLKKQVESVNEAVDPAKGENGFDTQFLNTAVEERK